MLILIEIDLISLGLLLCIFALYMHCFFTLASIFRLTCVCPDHPETKYGTGERSAINKRSEKLIVRMF